jgi:hypothetical protein
MRGGSLVSVLTKLLAGRLGFDSRQVQDFFFFVTVSRPALEITKPLIQWEPEAYSSGVKRPGREANQSSL